MSELTFTPDEKHYLIRALEYFKKAEEREIEELSWPSGNKKFIPECENRRDIYSSLINKLSSIAVKE